MTRPEIMVWSYINIVDYIQSCEMKAVLIASMLCLVIVYAAPPKDCK